jgi:hypothetical protein
MTKPRDLPLGSDFQATIDRLKDIVARSANSLLLADAPPHPDQQLLDKCAEALMHLREAKEAWAKRRAPRGDGCWSEAERRQDEVAMAEWRHATKMAHKPVREAKKMKAVTPAGIYAKALVVRCSAAGALEMAMSLAIDLVDCQALRATLWASEHVGRADA